MELTEKDVKRGLTSNVLKFIAIISMTLDHVAWAVFPKFSIHPLAIIMHILGRIACPVFCFLMVQGYIHTKNFKKYFTRIFVFAIISHFPYVLTSFNYIDVYSFIPCFYGVFNQTSVLWGFACGLLLIKVNDTSWKSCYKVIVSIGICIISFPADWSCVAPLIILFIWGNRDKFKAQMIAMVLIVLSYIIVYFFAIDKIYAILQLGVILAIPLLYFYNGKRGKCDRLNKLMKWFFYVYYPLHLVLIYVLL